MKQKITLLFALLCASVMGWATQYCDVPTGHENNADFGNTDARILLSIEPTGNANEYTLTVKPNTANGNTSKLDYIYVIGGGNSPYPAEAGTDEGGTSYDELSVTFTNSNASASFTIQWSTPGWGGRWQCTPADVPLSSLAACGSACADAVAPTVSAVATSNITFNSVDLAVTASDNVGVTRYIVKNGASQIASSTTTPITVTGLSSGTTYDNIKVIAKDDCDNESSEFAVTSFTTLTRESECIGAKGHFGNPSVKKVYYQIDYVGGNAIINLRSLTGNNLDYAEVQIVGVGNYAMTADGNGGYTYTINSPTVNTEWYLLFLYSDTSMPGNEMTAQNLNASDANIIYYKVGACTSTETENANIALSSAGASATASSGTAANAIDDNEGSRWESDFEDPQWICVDFGARKVFNKVQLLHQTAYIKSFQIQVSDDGTNFITIKNVSETLTDFDGEKKLQNIDLGGKFAARYLRIYGTERGTVWGYSLWELRAMYATTPVLTTYTLSIPTSFCTIGTTYPLTLTAKDQLGNDFPVETTYTVSPTSAGTVSAGVFTPLLQGSATITAEGGGKSSYVTVRNEVSADLALNQPATAGHNNENAYQSNNGNLGQRWGSNGATHYNAGANPDFGDWWYVDLGAKYDISEIAIKWETARPNDYDIRVSDDATTWTNIGTFNSYPSNTDYEYYNGLSAVPGRYVGVWARDGYDGLAWGISMWDFQVFGTENVSANKYVSATASPAAGGSVTVTAAGLPVTEVPNNTEVTFTATPNEGYDFVNWTNGDVEVSTSATYVTTITATTSLVANFETHRTAYCATPVTDVQASRTLYLTICRTENANEYKILLEGSADNKITSDNVYVGTNLTLGNVNGESSVAFTQASGEWHVSSDGFGSAYITFTAANFRNITFINKGVDLYRDMSGGGGDLSSFNAFPDASLIQWDATCVDEEAPVLDAPVATPLSSSTVRLAMAATDNMAALLTYSITYKPKGSADAGTNIEINGTAGETTYLNIKGLTSGTNYQFSITASDGTNTSAARVCYATPAMPKAPVPTHAKNLVRSIYSDAYPSALAHDFIKNNWAWPTYIEENIGGDHILVYTSDPAVQAQMPDVAWGDNNDGDNAIIANEGCNDGTNKGLDVRNLDYIHFDIWSAIATIYPEIYLNDTKLDGFQLDGSGWQSFNISLSGLTDAQKQNIRWIKFIALRTPNPEEIAIDNVYFWSDGGVAFTPEDGWATYAPEEKVAVPSGVTAYKAAYEKNGNEELLVLTDIGSVIPANAGVLMKGNPNGIYRFVASDGEAPDMSGNVLVGCPVRTDISSVAATNDIFCLRYSELFSMTGFFLYSGQYIPAGKAYLPLPKEGPTPAPNRRLRFVIGHSTPTGVENVQRDNVQCTKVIENGQLLIRRGDAVYTIQGARVK